MMSVRSRILHGWFASSTSISSTTAARSVGGLGHVAVCCNGVPSGGGGSAPYQFWHCFEKRTLRGSSHDCFKHSVDRRSFNSHTRVTFSGERKGLPCNTISLSVAETDEGPTSHTQEEQKQTRTHSPHTIAHFHCLTSPHFHLTHRSEALSLIHT